LEVRVSNAAARSLYKGFGFREVGVRESYYADGEDAVVLGLEL
ncbi:MAG: ribosomal-protein-alanine N-acetyltransferase RimI, partial [bacterium]